MVVVRFWRWYQRCLNQYPLRTQVISSGVLWGIGDISAQTITHFTYKNNNMTMITRHQHLLPQTQQQQQQQHEHPEQQQQQDIEQEIDEFRIDWKRVAITSMFGFAFVGPIGNYWYEGLDRFVINRFGFARNSFRFITAKLAADGLVFGPLDLIVFFSYMGFSMGKSVEQVKEDLKRDFLPAFVVEGAVWPLVQTANFRFVPVKYQLLYVNVFCLLDSAFLSWVEQQDNAPWKQWITSFLPIKGEESQS